MRYVLAILLACGLVSCGDDKYEAFYPHHPKHWVTTLGGHTRDAGPFKSVKEGFTSDGDIDRAIDEGFGRFRSIFPGLPLGNPRIAINDDYVLYVRGRGWAGGVSWTDDQLWVCLWSRGYSDTDPGAQYIKRHPGNSFGTYYTQWRFTTEPLMPALCHELLHTVINDPDHLSWHWSYLNSHLKGSTDAHSENAGGCGSP